MQKHPRREGSRRALRRGASADPRSHQRSRTTPVPARTCAEDTDDEEDENEEELLREAEEFGGDGGADVGVAPAGPAAPLHVLDEDALANGVWCGVAGTPLEKSVNGVGEAHLCAEGRTIATFRGTLKSGGPHGHGRLEMSSGDGGWCGEIMGGMVGGCGEAWDEAGNRFSGNTRAPAWLVSACY